MRVIDSHYRWYPRAHFEKLAAHAVLADRLGIGARLPELIEG